MNRNTKLAIIFVGQIILIVILGFVLNTPNSIDYNPKSFTVADTAAINKVTLKTDEGNIELSIVNGKWFVNAAFAADKALIRTLKSVLNRVEVIRPVSQSTNDEILNSLKEQGTLVNIDLENESKAFYTGGNESKTVSYWALDDKVYRVGVPGYNDYLSAIFSLTEIQWKDRQIFNSTWTSVNKIIVDHSEKPDFEVVYENSNLSIPGLNPLDTNNMMNYVYQFDNYLINEYLAQGQFERYDSLSNTKAMATISLTDIDETKNLQLTIFPRLNNEAYHLAIDNKNRWMMIDRARTQKLLPDRSFFVKNQ